MSENKDLKLTVASSPHVNSPVNTQSLMIDVLIALIPAMCLGVVYFGPRALVLTAVSVVGCVVFEWLYRMLMKKPQTTGDMSAVITGVLLAFVCPVALPYWFILVGDFIAIILVKQLFGGLGKNFLNPALAGRAFMTLCSASAMSVWVRPGNRNWLDIAASTADAITGATPLAAMHGSADAAAALPWASAAGADLKDLFIGNVGGCIGEVSAMALLLGGFYLIWRGVIHIRIPAAYLGTVALLTFLFPRNNPSVEWMLAQLLSGGLLLGAFFMATDYVTSPCTPRGELIFGIGCGLLTVFMRYFGGYPEGVSYAILLMNLLTPAIEKHTMPRRFGASKRKAQTAKKGGAQV